MTAYEHMTELAARISGISVVLFNGKFYKTKGGATSSKLFDPLFNMQHAANLAVAMRIHVRVFDNRVMASHRGSAGLSVTEYFANHNGNETKAYRHAVVRAVCNLGRVE